MLQLPLTSKLQARLVLPNVSESFDSQPTNLGSGKWSGGLATCITAIRVPDGPVNAVPTYTVLGSVRTWFSLLPVSDTVSDTLLFNTYGGNSGYVATRTES